MHGICHLCQRLQAVKYCGICKHWLCDECRPKWPARAKAAVRVMTGRISTDCCGPLERVNP